MHPKIKERLEEIRKRGELGYISDQFFLLSLIEQMEKVVERAGHFSTTMSEINQHMGYKFTQPIINFRETLAQFQSWQEEQGKGTHDYAP